jgi:DNA-binding transcriptional LysR family regulator
MQLHQLRYAVAVADEHHFTRAAARLHVAQPSVSSAVHDLERELGTPLFHRTRGEITLTAAGEMFLPWARQVLTDCEAGRQAVREVAGLQRGRVALGATPSLTTTALPPIVGAFHRRYPGIELALYEAGSRHLVDRLEQGQLDAAVLILPVKESWVETTPLRTEPLVLAVCEGHELADRQRVEMAELRSVPLVMFRDGYDLREVALGACRQAGFEPQLAAEGLEMDGVLALTAAGVGAAVVPASVVEPGRGLHAIAFTDSTPEGNGRSGALRRTVGLARRRDRPLPHAAAALVDEVCHALTPPARAEAERRSVG